MAIPPIEISTRKLDVAPSLQYFKSSKAEDARVVGGTISDVATGLNRIVEVQRRANEREAEYAVQQADNFVRNGWLGTDTQDEATGEWRHNPGVADRTWEQMRDDKTTPLDEMRRLQKAVREQEFYTNLTPDQRKVFERKWLFKSDEHSRTAQQHHQRLSLARIQDETRRTIEMRGEEVGRVYGADDLVYTKVAGRNALLNWADMQGTALNERSRAMLDDPRCNFDDIAKSQGWDGKTRAQKLHEYRKVALGFDINRITAFQQAAATGRNLGAYSPDQCADIADRMTDSLNGNAFGRRPDGTKKGTGWLGNVGSATEVITEFSARDGEDDGTDAVRDANGNLIDYPTLVPGLSKVEVEAVRKAAAGDKDVLKSAEWSSVIEKSRAHAKKQIASGKSVWANSGTGEEMITDAEAAKIHAETDKARKKLEALRVEVNRRDYDACLAEVGEIELDLLSPQKVAQTGNGLNYDKFCEDLAARHPTLSKEQSVAIRKQYRQLCTYFDKYTADLAKHNKAVADKENKRNSQYGWFKEDGSFVPATAFPKDSDGDSMKEFNEESAVWQNPKNAMARLEAARMTGRLSEADYKRYYAYGTMMMDKEAQNWWFKNYGKFDIHGLTRTEYGETDVKRDIRKSRERGNYSAASGIFAANRGVGKAYGSAADFVADTLENDREDGNETLVPLDVLPKVYDTVRRFARAGVDPADAVRAILQPALQEGIRRDITERLSDPDYFNAVIEDFKTYGTHFTDEANANAAAGTGVNWRADRNQAVTDNLVRQKRVTVKKRLQAGNTENKETKYAERVR